MRGANRSGACLSVWPFIFHYRASSIRLNSLQPCYCKTLACAPKFISNAAFPSLWFALTFCLFQPLVISFCANLSSIFSSPKSKFPTCKSIRLKNLFIAVEWNEIVEKNENWGKNNECNFLFVTGKTSWN